MMTLVIHPATSGPGIIAAVVVAVFLALIVLIFGRCGTRITEPSRGLRRDSNDGGFPFIVGDSGGPANHRSSQHHGDHGGWGGVAWGCGGGD